jgi:hypothetical protein
MGKTVITFLWASGDKGPTVTMYGKSHLGKRAAKEARSHIQYCALALQMGIDCLFLLGAHQAFVLHACQPHMTPHPAHATPPSTHRFGLGRKPHMSRTPPHPAHTDSGWVARPPADRDDDGQGGSSRDDNDAAGRMPTWISGRRWPGDHDGRRRRV